MFNIECFRRIAEQGAYFLSRYRMGTSVFYQGQRHSRYHLLKQQGKDKEVELNIELGQDRLPCRLVAQPAPKSVAEQRRERIHKDAKKKGQPQVRKPCWQLGASL